MASVESLIGEYHARLASTEPVRTHEMMHAAAMERGAFYGDRITCQVTRPFFISRSDHDAVHHAAQKAHSAIRRAAEAADENPALGELLTFTDTERRLLAIDGGGVRPDTIGRLDAFADPAGGLHFIEYNGESPGGIAYGDALGDVFDRMPLVSGLRDNTPFDRTAMMPRVVEAFRSDYHEWCEQNDRSIVERPNVAIVDFRDMPTAGEFELFRQAFEAAGLPCRIAPLEDLEIRDGRLFCDDFAVDIVYRRLITPDLLQHDLTEHPIVEAAKERLCFVGNGFGGYALSHKGLFAVLSDPELTPGTLTAEERSVVAATIPWTRLPRPGVHTNGPDGDRQPLDEIVLSRQGQLVIKPTSGYGGQDVVLGWASTTAEWEAAWKTAVEERRHVVQARVPIPVETYPTVNTAGQAGLVELSYDIDPYVLRGRATAGLGVRLSGSDLMNVASGAGSAVPAYVLR